MRNFWGFYDNGKYRVGCNSGTIYVYDLENRELAKFKDITYATTGEFQPNSNIFVAKSIAGTLAVYDIDHLTFLKKITITSIGAQDEGFAFTPDGRYFYNIEKPKSQIKTQLAIYDTLDFSRKEILFANCDEMHLEEIEFDETGNCYVLGFFRGEEGVLDYGFVGKLLNQDIQQMKQLSRDQFEYVSAYLHWKRSGFTKKQMDWSRIKDYTTKSAITIKELLFQ